MLFPSHPLKFAPLALLLLCQGCVTSTYVSAIGARTQVATMRGHDPAIPQRVMLADYQQGACVIEGIRFLLPYLTRCTAGDKTEIGWIEVDPDQIEWTLKRQETYAGKVDLLLPEGRHTFQVTSDTPGNPATGHAMNLERRYRRWYGYPAQLLLVATVPVDVMIFTGATAVIATRKATGI